MSSLDLVKNRLNDRKLSLSQLLMCMDKVVILARVSTDKQEYQRQLVELREYCAKVGWKVAKEFANKVSGARKVEERAELIEMIEYIKK